MERRSRFDRLYREYADRVMNYCLRHLSPSHAEDAVADTFLIAWRRIDDVPEPAVGWLIITARHTIFTRYRAQAKAQTLVERLARITSLAAEAPDVTLERREMLLTALNSLTEDEREALFLTAWDGLSGEDAAEVIGCRQGALRMRLHRARQKLSEGASRHSYRRPDFASVLSCPHKADCFGGAGYLADHPAAARTADLWPPRLVRRPCAGFRVPRS